MGYTFARGNPNEFRLWAESEKRRIEGEAFDIVQEVVQDAVRNQKRVIDTAETNWGRFRQSQGRASAGRRETDAMYDSVTSKVDKGPRQVDGYFGWLHQFRKYFEFQDNGTTRIEAANSLAQAFIQAEQDLQRKIRDRIIRRRSR